MIQSLAQDTHKPVEECEAQASTFKQQYLLLGARAGP